MSAENPIRATTLVAGILLACMAGRVAAQTCQSPLPLPANQSITGDTCTGWNSLGHLWGGLVDSPYADVVYRFTTPDRGGGVTDEIAVAVLGGVSSSAMVALLDTCDDHAPIVAFDDTSDSDVLWADVPLPPFRFTRPPWGGRPAPVAPATYYVVVSATAAALAPGCVDYVIERRM